MFSIAHGCLALSLIAAPALAAPRPVCYTVQRGDTAALVSLRLTGGAANFRAPWFQIVDPATLTIVPKSRYDRIQPGWQACIPQAGADFLPGERRIAPAPGAMTDVWVPVLLVAGALLAGVLMVKAVRQDRATRVVLERFGKTFIHEFERPLTDRSSVDRPLRSALRVQPERNRIEILIAPAHGRRYPNLSDHRRNLEYDVERVVRALDARQFSCGRFETRGAWIVIPFQLQQSLTKAGLT